MSENPDKVRMHLPVENWLDIFAHIPRQQLANQLATVNWKFAAIAQLWLDDKCGKVTMQRLYLTESLLNPQKSLTESLLNPPSTALWDKSKEFVPFPSGDVPMPSNIVDFEEMVFSAFPIDPDDGMRGMLEQMGPLLSNVNICCPGLSGYHLMRQLMPSLHSIKSIRVDKNEGMWPRDWPQCLVNVSTLICLGRLASFGSGNVGGALMDWLLKRGKFAASTSIAGEGDESEPRVLIADMYNDIGPIFEKFNDATSPSTFFIRINRPTSFRTNHEVRNMGTGEILKKKTFDKFTLISRHPIGADTEEWVAKKEEEVLGWKWEEQKRRIVIRHGYIGEL